MQNITMYQDFYLQIRKKYLHLRAFSREEKEVIIINLKHLNNGS